MNSPFLGERIGPTTPITLFAFLDIEHPGVAWAVQRGVLVSARYADLNRNPGFVSMMMAGMLHHKNFVRLRNELLLDAAREITTPTATPRLQGLYFFRSREEARLKIGDKRWPPYFRETNLTEFLVYPAKGPSQHDADWITHAPRNSENAWVEDDGSWMKNYWLGRPRTDQPTWEVLVDGFAVVVDEPIRRASYQLLLELFPRSEPVILMARLGGEAGSSAGMITPCVIRGKHGPELTWIMQDADFHNLEVLARIQRHPDAARLATLMVENKVWEMPDFTNSEILP